MNADNPRPGRKWRRCVMISTDSNDPLGYVDELREALGSPYMQLVFHGSSDARAEVLESLTARPGTAFTKSSLSSFGDTACKLSARWELAEQVAEKVPALREDAIAVVAALGFCRLYGINVPSDIKSVLGVPLPPELLVPAIDETLRILHSATDDARTLPEQFDGGEPIEDRSYCTSLLHLLMELWALFVVVDDEYQKHICEVEQGSNSLFAILMRRLLDGFAALDDELQRNEQIRLLSVATELPLLDNWRRMLAKPYRELLPWWLDGTLEAAAEGVRQLTPAQVKACLPR